jgi:transcriptional regulator with XRE-family HTH domain
MSHRLYPLDRDYAQELKVRRQRARLSQNDIALAIGCAEATIGKYERMAAPVSPEMRQAIEHALAEAEKQKVAV